ncbi:MAG: DUF3810 domain-containing protein [Clostridia bacterium]|nr:DUF3810 domain-containing protein [Clostridia bacterium]
MLTFNKKRRFGKLNTIALLAFIVYVVYLFANIPFFAEYVFARGITRFFSALINCITNLIPISFYEITAVLLILIGVLFIVSEVTLLCGKKFARALQCLYKLAVVILSVLLAFGVLYAPLYNRDSVNDALGLELKSVTEEEVCAAAEYFIDELNATSDNLSRDGNGDIIATGTFKEVAKTLNAQYDALNSSYFAGYNVYPKRVVLSEAMSYLGITGIYFPFFAEANVNALIPTYQLPVIMAHEMAHAKGVAIEGEANVAAYVVCIRSDDDYLKYSGLMYAVATLVNNSGDNYTQLRSQINGGSLKEYANASAHYAEYEGWIDSVSSFFNNLFLKANGVSGGTKSYGETVQSIVALYYSLI